MNKFHRNINTALFNPRLLFTYLKYASSKVFGQDPKITTKYGYFIGHISHFSEFWSVKNNIEGTLEQEYRLVKNILTQNGCAFDIGANVGVFTMMMSKASPSSLIHSFEPTPKTFSILQLNLQDNLIHNVIIKDVALSNTDGKLRFQEEAGSPSQNKIFVGDDNEKNTIEVTSLTIDEYCFQNKIGLIDFVKIDVEGAEILVLQGAKTMLSNRKIKALLIEVIPHAIVDMGFEMQDLVDYITNVGYSCYKVNEDGSIGKDLCIDEMRKFSLENILLLPNT